MSKLEYQIYQRHGHYEIYINGKFFCSTDTMTEAAKEIEAYASISEG